ncbi:MAG: Bug family tripartite tricarboxylate transporter substrate binding protein, partial [Candidatus Binatia bacterium]
MSRVKLPIRILPSAVFLFSVIAFLVSPMLAHAAAYFEGKTITIVVGYKPGGGYDRTARMLARHLPDHIPGKPSIIVQNMPGANSLI